VRALVGTDWLTAIDAVARDEGLLPREPSRALVGAIREVSDAYNALGRDPKARRPMTSSRDALAARLHFFLTRDIGKTYEASADLLPRIAAGARLRIVDLGAGLGASALGLALRAREQRPDLRLELTLLDDDRGALAIAEALFGRLFPGDPVTVRTAGLAALAFEPRGDVDVVLASNVLCELDRGMDVAARADRAAALVQRWMRGLAEDGHVLVVEPALKATARALQGLRGRLAMAGWGIVAPCTHSKGCPLLVDEGDWCHEDRAVALPAALIPIARAAGLHYEGLSFSFLCASRAPVLPRPNLGRVVAPPREAKGKRGLTLCASGDDPREGAALAFERLDRHRGEARDAWLAAERGSVLALEPWPAAPGRLAPEVAVRSLRDGEP
jgi:ribosomal protein RSM22 (predicted rRNA methylase)